MFVEYANGSFQTEICDVQMWVCDMLLNSGWKHIIWYKLMSISLSQTKINVKISRDFQPTGAVAWDFFEYVSFISLLHQIKHEH